MSVSDLIGAGLAINKIVDQGAEIKRSAIDYRTLSNKYNKLVDRYNTALDHIENISQQLKDLTEKTELREKELMGAFTYKNEQVRSLEEQIVEYKEQIQLYIDEFDRLKKEHDVQQAVEMTVMRILEEIPEENRMQAMAKVMAEHTPESLNREFVIACGHEIEKRVQDQAIFPNKMTNPAKYYAYKKEAMKEDPAHGEEVHESASMR